MQEKQTNNNLAIVCVVTATLCMSLQDSIVKLVSSDLTLWQIFSLRGCISLLLLGLLLVVFNSNNKIIPTNFIWSAIRSCLLVFMYISFYFALFFVDLSVVAGLYYTGPIFIVLFSWLLLNEKITVLNIGSILLGFIGVIVIINPQNSDLSFTVFLPILSAIFYALAMVTTKGKCQKESLISLVVSLNIAFVVIGCLFSIIIYALNLPTEEFSKAPFLLNNWAQVESLQWIVLFILAAINIAIHFLLAKAYKIGDLPTVAGFDYSYLIFAVLWGWLLLSEIPTINTLIGIAIIMLSGLIPIIHLIISNKRYKTAPLQKNLR